MPKIPILSESGKKYIRQRHLITPISQMAEHLKMSWMVVKKFMDSEDLKMKPRKKGKGGNKDRGGRYNVTRKIPVTDGIFNVFEHENWIM